MTGRHHPYQPRPGRRPTDGILQWAMFATLIGVAVWLVWMTGGPQPSSGSYAPVSVGGTPVIIEITREVVVVPTFEVDEESGLLLVRIATNSPTATKAPPPPVTPNLLPTSTAILACGEAITTGQICRWGVTATAVPTATLAPLPQPIGMETTP